MKKIIALCALALLTLNVSAASPWVTKQGSFVKTLGMTNGGATITALVTNLTLTSTTAFSSTNVVDVAIPPGAKYVSVGCDYAVTGWNSSNITAFPVELLFQTANIRSPRTNYGVNYTLAIGATLATNVASITLATNLPVENQQFIKVYGTRINSGSESTIRGATLTISNLIYSFTYQQ